MTTQQVRFNHYFSRFRALAEITIGMLKLRFLILKERVNSTRDDGADEYIRACIALHNFSILNGDLIYHRDLDEVDVRQCQCSFCVKGEESESSKLDGIIGIGSDGEEEDYMTARERLYSYFLAHIIGQ